MRKLVVGNWKMNGSSKLLSEFAKSLDEIRLQNVDIVLCPPSVYLSDARSYWGQFATGGQDCSPEAYGAFTGELSGAMLRDCGSKYVIVGHSERRIRQQESSEIVARKAAAAQRAGLTPILCIGETREERLVGATLAILHDQLSPCLDARVNFQNLVVAYEPIWSIGTGDAAGPDDVSEALMWIKEWIKSQSGWAETLVLYGGSVKGNNASSLFDLPAVDGVLVGGASLDVAEFQAIAAAADESASTHQEFKTE